MLAARTRNAFYVFNPNFVYAIKNKINKNTNNLYVNIDETGNCCWINTVSDRTLNYDYINFKPEKNVFREI